MKTPEDDLKRGGDFFLGGPQVNKFIVIFISILMTISSAQAAISVKGVSKNLFETLLMGNYKSGVRKLCGSDQKCIISLTQIRCAINIKDRELSQTGNCTYKNKSGKLSVLKDEDAYKLAQQLIVYGADYSNNGVEVKISVATAICAGQKNAAGQFTKRCQLRD